LTSEVISHLALFIGHLDFGAVCSLALWRFVLLGHPIGWPSWWPLVAFGFVQIFGLGPITKQTRPSALPL
jgi:hypothetical protein